MSLSAKDAAERVGMTKPGIIKAIRQGRVSAEKDQKGEWRIEPAELFRVYPPINQNNQQDSAPVSSGISAELTAERAKNTLLETMLEDVRADRDEWRKQAQQLALTDHRKPSLWTRLRGA